MMITHLQQGMLDLTRLWLRSLRGDALLAAIPGALALLWLGHTEVVTVLQAITDAFLTTDPQGRSALGVLVAQIPLSALVIGALLLVTTLTCHTVIIRRQWRQLDDTSLLTVDTRHLGVLGALVSMSACSLLYVGLCLVSIGPTPWVIMTLATLQIPLLMKVLAALLFLSIAAIPAIWLSIALLPLPYLGALSGAFPIGLLRRSVHLMRGRWWIGSLYASIAGTLYSSALLLIPFVVLLLVFWWQGGLNVDGPEVDHLHWLATTITASRWLLWPFDALLLPLIHASCLVVLRQALQASRNPPAPNTTHQPTSVL
jgi:hypothetical protein